MHRAQEALRYKLTAHRDRGRRGRGRYTRVRGDDDSMKEQSIKYLLGKGCENLQKLNNKKTAAQYAKNTAKFAAWLSEQGVKRPSQLERKYGGYTAAIQAYADYLGDEGKTASTTHTYIAACCVATGVPLSEIRKPKRITSSNIRSRETGKNARAEKEAESGRYDDLIAFQEMVGIRRAELARLTGADLVTDESGHTCVLVKKGKGGKAQLQRILPEHEDFVRSYFDGSNKRIFSVYDMKNHLDLHALRAKHAQAAYRYYASLDDQGREQLRKELAERYIAAAKNPDKVGTWLKELDKDGGVYRLRGGSRRLAIRKGLPLEYDRLALMATSVYCLSHWRLDVTVSNYMLSV